MMSWDANEDGVLTRDEVSERMWNRLNRFDTNGDDSIDPAELEATTERMRQRPRHIDCSHRCSCARTSRLH